MRPCRLSTVAVLAASMLLASCTPDASPVTGVGNIEPGIWMLSKVSREQDGKMGACRPMLMEVWISDTSVDIGERAFPCGDDMDMPPLLHLTRNGSDLYLGKDHVGTMAPWQMSIALPGGERTILWDMDRVDAQWQETGAFGGKTAKYSAKLEHRVDGLPVPQWIDIEGLEDQPMVDWVHVASLPRTKLTYSIAQIPQYGNIDFWDSSWGHFRIIPPHDYAGQDEFRFDVTGPGFPVLPEGAVRFTFAPTPDAPEAIPGFMQCLEDNWCTYDSAAQDPDEDPVQLTITTLPQHGQVSTNGAQLSYHPNPDFAGADFVEFTATDGTRVSDPARVEWLVFNVNDSPKAGVTNIRVSSDCATPFAFNASDIDSVDLHYDYQAVLNSGQIAGDKIHPVFVPKAGLQGASETFSFQATDGSVNSNWSTAFVTIEPGAQRCDLLTIANGIDPTPTLISASQLLFRVAPSFGATEIHATQGTEPTTQLVQTPQDDTFGFGADAANMHRPASFDLGSAVFFTAATKALGVRVYRATNAMVDQTFDIAAPGNEIVGQPEIEDVNLDATTAYAPMHWRTKASDYVCEVWKWGAVDAQASLVHHFQPTARPCQGLYSLGTEKLMFVGSNLYKFTDMQSPPQVVKDLGNAESVAWMVVAGSRLFFQTRATVGTKTQIDLWVTDGTANGTTVVKQIEATDLAMNIFSPLAMGDKLYFAHRKSLWVSDGTPAGTNIVKTIPVTNIIGNGAIGTIAAFNGRLYFLATSDATGREPWVSDGTAAGTTTLLDIRPGTMGSSLASANPAYFHLWKSKVVFLAQDGADAWGLWSTDGTSVGTKLLKAYPMVTIMGIIQDKLILHDGNYMYAMTTP